MLTICIKTVTEQKQLFYIVLDLFMRRCVCVCGCVSGHRTKVTQVHPTDIVGGQKLDRQGFVFNVDIIILLIFSFCVAHRKCVCLLLHVLAYQYMYVFVRVDAFVCICVNVSFRQTSVPGRGSVRTLEL